MRLFWLWGCFGFFISVIFISVIFVSAMAQEPQDEVAAIVGDHKILVSQVEQEFANKFAERGVSGDLATRLRFQILQRLVDQQLVLEKFTGSDVLATGDEVDLEVSRIGERLKRTENTLDDFLASNQQSMTGLKFNIRWQISWKRYIDKTLTDKVLQRYFEKRRRQFDGTRMRVAHLLIKLPPDADDSAVRQTSQQAREWVRQISAGELTWTKAVADNSQAPSAAKGGDIGWIGFHEPMPRPFSKSAFKLDVDGISQPVRTRFGIHVIKCLDIEQGMTGWYDVKPALRHAATEELFEIISTEQKSKTVVRFTGAVPNPGAESGASDRR